MVKFYICPNILLINFRKPFFCFGLMLIGVFLVNSHSSAQCLNSNSSGVITAPAPGNTLQINSCAFAGDYSTINGITASTSYTVTSNSTPVTDYFTIRQGTPGGPVIAYGASPLTWTAVTAGTYYAHVNSYYACGTQATCRTTSITNNGSCSPPIITVTPNSSCGGTCVPITASGADSYTWFPFTGLYLNCSATAPYTGGNAVSLYAQPLTNTVYTVTGKINATGCTGTTTATVNYTPPAPTVFPNPVNMCVGDPPVRLVAVSSPNTSQFCSGQVNIPIPDNDPAGSSSNIVVAGIPGGAQWASIDVTINMAHTRAGDMVFVLKAPNGQVINLDYFLAGTRGNGATTGFTNTVISSSGTASLSSGFNPYTGIFRADLSLFGSPGYPAGPTGMAPTGTWWGGLFSSINGIWTLGFYDGISGETGIVNNWCISIRYTTGTVTNSTAAVWTPAAGLFFDPAATVPYIAGTAVDTVWVKPAPAGVYQYQVTTQSPPPNLPVCTSLPRTVVVNVYPSANITSQPVDQYVCAGSGASFTVAVAGQTPTSYQWQISANGGATYTNIANGAPYSGINTATLTLATTTLVMSGYRYRVIINGGGNCGAISQPAILTVNPVPVVVISANPTIVLPGRPTTIHSSVTPNPGATYTWYHNGSVVVGATEDSLVVDINGLGDYRLQVVDINGCTALSNIVTITDQFSSRLFVYPNPSSGIFQARYFNEPNTTSPRSLIIYNNRGEQVVNRSFIQTISYQRIDIDLRPYGKGIYRVILFDQSGRRIAMNNVVVQ